MKKTFTVISLCIASILAFFITVLAVISAGVSLLGGANSRNMGDFSFLVSDGKNNYLQTAEYYLKQQDNNNFYLVDANDIEVESLIEKQASAEKIFSVGSNNWGRPEYSEGYDYIYQQLLDKFDGSTCFECVIFNKDGRFYGAVNQYKRWSGPSRNLLTNEQIIDSYLITLENNQVVFTKELKDTAILAFNQSHFIAYKNKTYYSVNTETEEETRLFKDEWWDYGPTHYSHVNFYFTDDSFVVCGQKNDFFNDYTSLFICKMDGSEINKLLDKK